MGAFTAGLNPSGSELWPPALATFSLSLTLLRRHNGLNGSEAFNSLPTLTVLARAVALAWLVGGLLARSAEVRLLSAIFLASSPGVRWFERATYVGTWLACHLVVEDSGICYWAPLILLLLQGVNGPASALPEKQLSLHRTSRGLQDEPSQRDAPQKNVVDLIKQFPNWSAPTQRELRAWKKAFAMEKETLLAVYACAVPCASLLHRGSLYISEGRISFRGSAIVTKTLQFSLRLEDLKEIRNGGSRDVATLMLAQPVQMRGWDKRVTSIEFRGCEAGSVAIAAMLDKAGGDEDEDEFEDSDDGDPDGDASPQGALESCKSAASLAMAAFAADEPFRSLLEVYIPRLRISSILDEVLASKWPEGSLFMEYFGMQGATDVSVGPWIEDTGGAEAGPGQSGAASSVKVREVTMVVPVPPAPMAPRKTKLTTTYCLAAVPSQGDVVLTVQSSSVSHDVPFGDKFLVQERLELVPSQDGAGVRVHKHGRCVFLKSCGILQWQIQASSALQVTKTGEYMVSLLKKRVSQSVDRKPSTADKTICTLHIWELQRRATIWSSTWHPPFLPHDGRKRWRWVDTSYQKHPWTVASCREASAACTNPPVEPQEGWLPLGDWSVSHDPGDCDAEGWQYAIDFYRDSRFWINDKTGLHVRRRLWTRSFVDKDGRVAPNFAALRRGALQVSHLDHLFGFFELFNLRESSLASVRSIRGLAVQPCVASRCGARADLDH